MWATLISDSGGDKPLTAAIQQRVSCRNYSVAPLQPETLAAVTALLTVAGTGPLGARPRFRLLRFGGEGTNSSDGRRLGTYGFIRNAVWYVAGAVSTGDDLALADYGYVLERIVLNLTVLGLGTCWLAGSYDRTRVATDFGLLPGETIPAVTPVGHPAPGKTAVERLIRLVAGSRKRRPWDEVFFAESGEPLESAAAGRYAEPLECVRLAPSAANRQPWRVFVDTASGSAAFYSSGPGLIDVGIAMQHFEVGCLETGIAGRWERVVTHEASRRNLGYLATWRPSGMSI